MGEQPSYIHCWGVPQGSRSWPPASTGTLRYTPPVNVGNCTFFHFKKESPHSLQGNMLGLLLLKKRRRRRLQSKQLSAYCHGKELSNVFVELKLRQVVISCEGRKANTMKEQVRRLGFWRSVHGHLCFWPFQGRLVGSRKRSIRRAFEIAQSKRQACRGSTRQCFNCRFTS